jgi:hypothetical protein
MNAKASVTNDAPKQTYESVCEAKPYHSPKPLHKMPQYHCSGKAGLWTAKIQPLSPNHLLTIEKLGRKVL